MDYDYITLYLGQEYATELKKVEKAKEEEAKALMKIQFYDLQAQRDELLRRLKSTRQDFFLNSEVELSLIAEVLRISRAFVFSYFDNIFGPYKQY